MGQKRELGRSSKNPTTWDQEMKNEMAVNTREERRKDTPNRDEKSGKMAERNMSRRNRSPEPFQSEQCHGGNASGEPMKTRRRE